MSPLAADALSRMANAGKMFVPAACHIMIEKQRKSQTWNVNRANQLWLQNRAWRGFELAGRGGSGSEQKECRDRHRLHCTI